MSELGPIPPALLRLYADEQAAPVCGAEEHARIRTRVLATLGVAADAEASRRPLIDPALEEMP